MYRILRTGVALATPVFCLTLLICSAYANEPLRVGTAAVDITPPVGFRMSGYFYERSSTGTHDPLQAKAIVWQQGDVRFAWVFCDMLGITSEVTNVARTKAAEATGIRRENIFIAATHSHTGPLLFGPLKDFFHETAIKKNGSDPLEFAEYAADLPKKLVAAVQKAAAEMAPVEVSAGICLQPGLAFNRRYLLRDGTVKTNPGKLNKNIDRPAGPTDPQVGLLQFRRSGQPFAGLTVFALHCDTTGGTEYSADYPFYLGQVLRSKFGPHYLSIFAAGTCGDINHIDVSHDQPQKGIEEAGRIGDALGKTVAAALDSLPKIEHPRLATASKTLHVPVQRYTAEEVAAARAKLPKVGTREIPMLDQVAAVKIAWISDWDTTTRAMDVQAFRLSDSVALVALPGELFVELGLAIKQGSPFATTLVVELSNDYPGYVPTKRGFVEGSYEPTNSRIESGGGEMLVDATRELLKQLHDAPSE